APAGDIFEERTPLVILHGILFHPREYGIEGVAVSRGVARSELDQVQPQLEGAGPVRRVVAQPRVAPVSRVALQFADFAGCGVNLKWKWRGVGISGLHLRSERICDVDCSVEVALLCRMRVPLGAHHLEELNQLATK